MNTALRFPSPGQRLSADFGRQLAHNINALRITGGPGVRVTQGPNGVTISATARTTAVSGASDAASFPFKLAVFPDATDGKSRLAVMYADASVQLIQDDGGAPVFATAENNAVTTAAEHGWKYVASTFAFDVTGKATTATDLGALDDYSWDKDNPSFDVDVIVYNAGGDANGGKRYSAVVMVDGSLPTTLQMDDIIARVYIGTVERVTDEDAKTVTYSVRNQVVRDALALRSEEKSEADYPFRLACINAGTETSPDWKAIVYLPVNAVQSSTATATITNNLTAIEGRSGWYYVGGAAETDGSVVYLVCTSTTVVDSTSGAWSDEYLTFAVSRDKAQALADPTFSRTGETYTYRFRVVVGEVNDATGEATNILRSAYSADGWYLAQIDNDVTATSRDLAALESKVAGISSGNGSLISVVDNRTDYSQSGILGVTQNSQIKNDATSASGSSYRSSINITVNDGLGAGKVVLDDAADENKPRLNDYLKGGTTASGTAYGYGTNVTTENFADKCLPANDNNDPVTGTETSAARSDHKHYIDDILKQGAEGEEDVSVFSSLDAYTNYLISIGALPDPSDTSTSAETQVPSADQFVTYGDITSGYPATQGATGIGADASAVPFQDAVSQADNLGENVLSEAYLQQKGIEQGEWTRASDTTGKGFKYTICCGVHYIPEKYGVFLVYREVSVDKYGMIYHVSKAKFGLYYPIAI